ncbi:aspartyl/glutamyl-tRNA(Asn/Gln) amidotransferase subunit B [Fulvitalea axinellae]|uniref:Aspartyl/glutamyl-tRNA(Asn/Gln) amidotransferase subunit B n=1 Tax=Fulvitalea axinellae TaxID=1182444 RepID=A0AAU9CFR0_9BACT|nr:aspartyl/glutamyl-tRNA(Asn/Gln) amidotransferase subunit B [Fulvitalea axinellae]
MLDQSVRDKYTVVVGLEVHAQLLTKSKIYTSDSTAFGATPNTQVGVISLAHPGTLPKINKQAVEYAIKIGLACGCEISRENIFDRKNYFYPDLPKGYQLTQDKTPICLGGNVKVKTSEGEKTVILNRIHIEEDAGKSIHVADTTDTLVDLNRAGVPLVEIVTEPSIRSSEEAQAFLTEIRKLVRYLEICDGNMEEGSLRCDANVSVMPKGATEYGKKVEVKNMNSIRNVQRAIDHEAERLITLLENGEEVISETRDFDAVTGTTSGLREKEELNDYRYFPEPDLSPMIISEEWIESVRASMPSLPSELFLKFTEKYGLPDLDAGVLTDTKAMAMFFEELTNHTKNYKAASNWIMGPIKSYLNEKSEEIESFPLKAEQIAGIIDLVDEGKVSHTAASQQLFPAMLENVEKTATQIAEEQNLLQDSDEGAIQSIIDEVIAELPDKVKAYKNGKKGLLGMFMGQVMKKSKGKADPKVATQLLNKSLSK